MAVCVQAKDAMNEHCWAVDQKDFVTCFFVSFIGIENLEHIKKLNDTNIKLYGWYSRLGTKFQQFWFIS